MKYLIAIKPKTAANEEYKFLFNSRPSIPAKSNGKAIKCLVTEKYTGGKGFDFFISAASKIKSNAKVLAKNAEGTIAEEELGTAYLEIASSADHSIEVLKRALQTLKNIDEDALYAVRISEVSEDTII